MTALSIVQSACGRMSLDKPTALFSSTNQLDIQLRDLLNQGMIDLAKRCAWTKLTGEKTFTTVATEIQTSAVPSDFLFYVDDTMWNRTTNRKILGPLNSQEWQQIKAGPLYTSIYSSFRFRGGDILITPTATAGQTIAYEYVTNLIAENAAGSAIASFSTDTDTSILEEELLALDLIWRFKKSKGLEYGEDFNAFESNVELAISRDGGKRTLNLGKGPSMMTPQIPEGSW